MDFILIFQVFFQTYFIIKITKRGLFFAQDRKADVAQGGHMAEPREPTWTPTWH